MGAPEPAARPPGRRAPAAALKLLQAPLSTITARRVRPGADRGLRPSVASRRRAWTQTGAVRNQCGLGTEQFQPILQSRIILVKIPPAASPATARSPAYGRSGRGRQPVVCPSYPGDHRRCLLIRHWRPPSGLPRLPSSPPLGPRPAPRRVPGRPPDRAAPRPLVLDRGWHADESDRAHLLDRDREHPGDR